MEAFTPAAPLFVVFIGAVMDGAVDEVVVAAVLAALRAKGETGTEIAAAARAIRRAPSGSANARAPSCRRGRIRASVTPGGNRPPDFARRRAAASLQSAPHALSIAGHEEATHDQRFE
jgi:anthranilate phosphoribosyltransferase